MPFAEIELLCKHHTKVHLLSLRLVYNSKVNSKGCWLQVEKAPLESYADVGGLEQQVIEIKEAVELPLTHPELYQDIGIKPPKVWLS